MGHKAKCKKKIKITPDADANSRARQRIANQKHKREVLQKKIEELMKQRRQEMLTGDTVTKTATKKEENVDSTENS